MSDAANAFRAGIVIIVGTVIGVIFYVSSEKTSFARNSIDYYAYLTDATGINAKSIISIAGLKAGKINQATLVEVTIGEYVVDLEARVLQRVDRPLGPDVVVKPHDDFDGVVANLEKQGKLPTREAVTAEQWDEARVRAAIAKVKQERVRVARIDFAVSAEWPVPVDSWVKKGSLGLLGANALFLEPGPSKTMLKLGERLINVRSATSTETLLSKADGIVADLASITHKIDQDIGGITSNINGITGELNRFIAGDEDTKPIGEIYQLVMTDLRKAVNTVEKAVRDIDGKIAKDDSDFNKLVANVQRITADLAEMTGSGTGTGTGADGGVASPNGDAGDIRATMASVRKVADDLSVVTEQLKGVLGDNEEELGEGVKSLKTTIDELNRSLASLSEVMGRVERGEGTVGRLLTDEKIADKVESAVSGAADFVSSLTSMETHVDIGSWYNINRDANTTTLGLRLQPKPDKYYLLEVVDDGGRMERFTERDINGNVIRESVREEDNQLRISAMFAKRFFDFLVLRVGLIETTGGVGANLFLFDDRVELRSDLFNFRGPRDTLSTDALPDFYLPRWRTLVKAQPIPHLYVSAGIDDALNGVGPRGIQLYDPRVGYGLDYFIGVGLTFQDEDLRAILPFIPGG
ncbi:MAG: hypothetical protein A2138_10620 [Deltaproteobacteria bacterium RBG_16_71_12]|nr:MAG: hypothetical protein A2138_10620 [Deltaproteobacteria bacterium RBG_16_71_12]